MQIYIESLNMLKGEQKLKKNHAIFNPVLSCSIHPKYKLIKKNYLSSVSH